MRHHPLKLEDLTPVSYTHLPMDVNGIPHAFAVKNGKLIWRGHPVKLSEEIMQACLLYTSHTACPNCGTYTTRSGKEIVVKAEA